MNQEEIFGPVVTLIQFENEQEIKNAGKLRQEGKDYIINDGDIIFFKFNV